MSYVVGSKVKALIKEKGGNTAGDFVDALSSLLESEVKKAVSRAKANGRKTVRANDL